MRLVWVQQWSYLPVIVEDIDMNAGPHNRGRLPSTHLPIDNRLHSSDRGDSVATCMSPGITRPFYQSSCLTTTTAKPRGVLPTQAILSHGFNPQPTLAAGFPTDMGGQQPTAYHQAQEHSGAGFNLSELSDTLPQHFSQHEEADRSTSGSSTTLHQQSPSPFAGQTPMTSPGYNMYAAQYGTPYQQMTGNTQAYPHPQVNQTHQNLGQAPYSSHNYYPHQQQQPYVVYPSPYGQPVQHHPGLATPYVQPFGRGTNQGFGVGAIAQPIPDVAGVPGRISQYGGFSPSGHLGYRLGSGAMLGRAGPIQGRFASRKMSQRVSELADWDLTMKQVTWETVLLN